MRALLDEIAGQPAPRAEYVFRPELVVRGSTGAVPHAATPRGWTSAPRRTTAGVARTGAARRDPRAELYSLGPSESGSGLDEQLQRRHDVSDVVHPPRRGGLPVPDLDRQRRPSVAGRAPRTRARRSRRRRGRAWRRRHGPREVDQCGALVRRQDGQLDHLLARHDVQPRGAGPARPRPRSAASAVARVDAAVCTATDAGLCSMRAPGCRATIASASAVGLRQHRRLLRARAAARRRRRRGWSARRGCRSGPVARQPDPASRPRVADVAPGAPGPP